LSENEEVAVEPQVLGSDQPETETLQEQQPPQVAAPKRDAEYNFRELRRKLEDNERVMREQAAVIERLATKAEPEPALTDEDFVTVKDLKRIQRPREEALERERTRYREEILKLKCPDIDQVLSKEAIEEFEQSEPELAQHLSEISSDKINLKHMVYRIFKGRQMPTRPQSVEKKRAEDNVKKPVSVQAVAGNSPIGNASLFENGFSKQDRDRYWKEMQECMKRA
jgi:hypothetical protein